jgi:3-dehydroquinate dehydratase-2
MAKVLLINGPNLNLLGTREPDIYGSDTLTDIESRLQEQAKSLGHEVVSFQSNTEGALVDRIQAAAAEGVAYIIINAGALTHTSIALQDALAATAIPFIEVHISNIHAREAFRHQSYLSALATGVIVGLGTQGYELAMDAVARRLS